MTGKGHQGTLAAVARIHKCSVIVAKGGIRQGISDRGSYRSQYF